MRPALTEYFLGNFVGNKLEIALQSSLSILQTVDNVMLTRTTLIISTFLKIEGCC